MMEILQTKPKLGHVHLKVRHALSSAVFYSSLFDMHETENVDDRMIFLSNNEMHHVIALQEIGDHAIEPVRNQIGLYHVAFEVTSGLDFKKFVFNLKKRFIAYQAVDHGISWAVYFNDLDGNGLEVYWDTREQLKGKTNWDGMSYLISDADIEKLA